MRLSWKIYLILAAFVLLAASLLSVIVTLRETSYAQAELRDQERVLAALGASQVESGYHEQLWPFEMLSAIAAEKSVVAWHIVDGAGQVVLHHGDVQLPLKQVVALARQGDACDPDSPQLLHHDQTDLETWIVPMRMRTGGTAWSFALTFQNDLVKDRAFRSRTANILIAAVVILALLPTSLFVTRHFLKPLGALTSAVRQMTGGDLNVALPVPSQDEVGHLIRGFQEMAESVADRDARIQEQLSEICAARDQLEIRVRQRTGDLERRKAELEVEISERTKAEAAPREAQGWLRTLIDHAPEAIMIFDPEADRYVDVNENATRLFGRSRQELTQMGPLELSPPFLPDGQVAHHVISARRERVLAGETPTFEWTFLGRHGEEIPCEVRLVRLSRDDRWFVRASATDIRQRKAAQDKLTQLHEQLVEASRHAGMAEVATSVLHNVGNVLNSVNTSAGTAARTVRDLPVSELAQLSRLFQQQSASLAEFFATDQRGKLVPDYISQLADELSRQRDQILEEFRLLAQHIEHIKRIVKAQQTYATVRCFAERVPLDELVEIACSLSCAGSERASVGIACRFGRIGTVHVDKHRVLQIVTNLLTNAKQALENVPPEKRRIELFAEIDDDDQMVIAVADNGKGIVPEQLSKIFQYGFTTKANGHGYGLHSSANAAREMGGTLTVHSDGPGRGATFTLRVPQAADSTLEEEETLDPAGSNGHVAMTVAAGSCI